MTMANESVRETANRADPCTLFDLMRGGKIGDILTRTIPRILRAQVPVVSAETLGGTAYDRIALPDDMKASRVVQAHARSRSGGGGGALGELAVHAWGAVPTTGEIGIDGRGDLILLGTDLYTSVDVIYEPIIGDLITLTHVPVVSTTGVCTIPTPAGLGAFHVVNATSTAIGAGGLLSSMIIDYPNTTAPATTLALMNLAGTIVYFAIADAVTECSLTLYVPSAVEPVAGLVVDSTVI